MTTHLSTRLVWHDRAWDKVITSEDGPDGSINAAQIEKTARNKLLLES